MNSPRCFTHVHLIKQRRNVFIFSAPCKCIITTLRAAEAGGKDSNTHSSPVEKLKGLPLMSRCVNAPQAEALSFPTLLGFCLDDGKGHTAKHSSHPSLEVITRVFLGLHVETSCGQLPSGCSSELCKACLSPGKSLSVSVPHHPCVCLRVHVRVCVCLLGNKTRASALPLSCVPNLQKSFYGLNFWVRQDSEQKDSGKGILNDSQWFRKKKEVRRVCRGN